MTEFRSMTKADFKLWHDKYKADNGYPLPGRNAATGEIQPLSVGPTTEYTKSIEVDDTDVRFPIDEALTVKPGRLAPPVKYSLDGKTIDVLASKAELVAMIELELMEPIVEAATRL